MNFAGILPVLLHSLTINDSFTSGAQKIVSFIRKNEERFEAQEIINAILSGGNNRKKAEFILFSLLDICRADFDVLERESAFRQLRRLINKAVLFPSYLSAQEQKIIHGLHEYVNITTVDQLVAASRKATSLTMTLSQHGDITQEERSYLSSLLMFEGTALHVRTEWLSDHVDSYNMKAIARLLPLLTVCDERRSLLNDLADRIRRNETIGQSMLTFENEMRSDAYEKWKKKIGQEKSLTAFLAIMEQQRARLIPVRLLVAVATLSRTLHHSDAPPLTWIQHALTCCTADGFRMDIGSSHDKMKRFLTACNIVPVGSLITGSFASGSLIPLIGSDMLTRTMDAENQELSPKEMVMRCMSNDALLLRLLENPKVAGTPGIVAQIASISRSLSVLQKITQTKELYSGHANIGVPLALLKNPTHIPFAQLRQFINNRYLSVVEMREIVRNPYGIRREIYSEIKAFVDQRYK